jgi:exosortase/archaeosortase family protein
VTATAPAAAPSRPWAIAHFLGRFSATLLALYALYAWLEDSRGVELHLVAISELARSCLAAFFSVTRSDRTLSGDGFSATVGIGCDAAYPILCFVSGVLAFPARWRARATGLVFGIAILELANVARIAALFVIGVRFPAAFHVFHTQIFEGAFILLALGLWVIWAFRAGRGS